MRNRSPAAGFRFHAMFEEPPEAMDLPPTTVKLHFDESNMHTGTRTPWASNVMCTQKLGIDKVYGFYASAWSNRPDAGTQPTEPEGKQDDNAELMTVLAGSAAPSGVNEDIETRPGITTLMHAAHNCQTDECLKILASADFQRVNAATGGGTALHIAAGRGLMDVCQAILKHKDFTQRDAAAEDSGATALHAAARKGHVCIIPVLLAAGLDPNAQDASMSTPFMLACKYGGPEACLVLLAESASGHVSLSLDSLKAKDKNGYTAEDYIGPFPDVTKAFAQCISKFESNK